MWAINVVVSAEGFCYCCNVASSWPVSGQHGMKLKTYCSDGVFFKYCIRVWERKSGSHVDCWCSVYLHARVFCIAVGNKCPLSLSKCQISYQHLLACCCGFQTNTQTHMHMCFIYLKMKYSMQVKYKIWFSVCVVTLSILNALFTLILFAFPLHWLQTVLWYKCRFSPFVTHIHSLRCTDCCFTYFRKPKATEWAEFPNILSGYFGQRYNELISSTNKGFFCLNFFLRIAVKNFSESHGKKLFYHATLMLA